MPLFPLLCGLLTLFLSCTTPAPQEPTHFSQNKMTIDYHIAIGDLLNENQKQQAQRIIDTVFREIDDIYNKWNPESELSRLNTLPAYTPCLLSAQLNQFFQRLDGLVKLSEGRFDPTVEPLQKLWKNRLEDGCCPTPTEIASLKTCIGWSTLHVADGVFYKEDGRTQLDFGGVAKGLCVDLLIERLHEAGFQDLFVEWGGEIRTLGFHPSKRPWCVCISSPTRPDPSHAIAHLDLINRALATSGDYFQYWTIITEQGEQKTYCHVFNPLTLKPLEVKKGSIASASLSALDCTTADALAKVLMLFDSPEEAQEWIKTLQAERPYLACWIVAR